MAEYIERDMFLKMISHKPISPITDREDRLINGFISAVKNCPAADAIEDLEFACNHYEKDYKDLCAYLPKWIPVTERLPEPFESVLVCYQREGRYGTSCGHYYIDRGTTIWKASGIIPTHWMPLPEPPKGE